MNQMRVKTNALKLKCFIIKIGLNY